MIYRWSNSSTPQKQEPFGRIPLLLTFERPRVGGGEEGGTEVWLKNIREVFPNALFTWIRQYRECPLKDPIGKYSNYMFLFTLIPRELENLGLRNTSQMAKVGNGARAWCSLTRVSSASLEASFRPFHQPYLIYLGSPETFMEKNGTGCRIAIWKWIFRWSLQYIFPPHAAICYQPAAIVY